MGQTVIGIFKNSADAQNAKKHLLNNGFSDRNIDVSARTETNYSDDHDRDLDFGDRVSNFFKNLFGDSDEATNYTRAAARGTVVTVHAQNSNEAEAAADILDDYGAVDVDEYAAEYDTSEADRLGGMNSGRAGITDHTTTGVDSDMTNRNRDTDMTNRNIESDISDRTKDSNMANRNIETDISNRNRDMELTNRDIDTDMSNRNRDTDMSNRNRDTDMSNRNQDTDFSNRNRDTDMTNKNIETDRNQETDRFANSDETKIPIIEENLNVGKEEVVTGGKKIHSRIVERPVEETVRLREEHVNIERNPVDRKATEQDMTNFKEGTVEVTEHAEIPVVDKESRVVEEVNVYKDVDEKQEVIRETLRNTEVETDDIKARKSTRDDENFEDTDEDHHTDDPRHQRPGII